MKKYIPTLFILLLPLVGFTFLAPEDAYPSPEDLMPIPNPGNENFDRPDLDYFDLPKKHDFVQIPDDVVVLKNFNINTCEQKTVRFRPSRDHSWYRSGLSLDAHPQVISYRIQWFNGNWTEEIIPGVEDEDSVKNYPAESFPDEGRRKLWSYFYDHNHEITSCVEYFENYAKINPSERVPDAFESLDKILEDETENTKRLTSFSMPGFIKNLAITRPKHLKVQALIRLRSFFLDLVRIN